MRSLTTLLPMLLALPTTLAQASGTTSLIAVGLGVEDLARSRDFYTQVMGLKLNTLTFNTTEFDEIIVDVPLQPSGKTSGSSIALIKWKAAKSIKNNGVKLAFNVPDVKVQIEKIRAAGMKIVLEPGQGKIGPISIPTAFARDPDDYLLEINPLGFPPKLPGGGGLPKLPGSGGLPGLPGLPALPPKMGGRAA